MAPRRNGRATAVATVAAPIRCAIYTRKSTDEGLDRDFNSLDNQREAAEAFIQSQRHEGWTPLPERYDDGGFSGANLERPALKRLMADVDAGKLDCVVVYKLDRLSRSVRDYLNLLAHLDSHGVDFVSVTQQFNTTTPVGRMTLRMLLSFAEFERDIIAERTRDKLAASRRRGKYVGGYPVLGFDRAPEGGRLVVNEAEAEVVRQIFQLYLEKRSLVDVAAEVNERGWTLKRWTTKDGKTFGGGRFNRVNLHRMLTNHVYIGKVSFQGTVYDGEQDGIVSTKLFREVQDVLAENWSTGRARHRNRYGALLRGLLRCAACDTAMVHAPCKARGKLHRYYRCSGSMKTGAASCPTKSVKADKVEAFVVDQIRRIGASPELQDETFRQATLQVKARRRGLKLETKRLADDLARARGEVERLVATLSRATGPAADAVAAELAKAQERVQTLESRQTEVAVELGTVKAQDVDREAVARALEQFDPIWDVLLTPERERVLRLLIEKVEYDGGTGKLAITWRLSGFGELAAEVAP